MVPKKKIQVLFVIVQMKMGGSEHLVWDLIRSLDRDMFEPHLAWFYEDSPLQEFVDLDVPLYHIAKVHRFDWSTMRMLSKIISKQQIDVVNAHHFLSFFYSFYGCKLANRRGLVYTEHSLWEIEAISPKWRFIGRMLLPFADAAVGISDEVRNGLKSTFKLKGSKACVITNGVDCQLLGPAVDKAQYKTKYGFSGSDIIIGMVANLKNNKNHIFLLQVFRTLQKTFDNLKLVFVGQGFTGDPEGSEDEIRSFIKESDLQKSVSLLGARSDVPDLLKTFDIFCLTSFQEGLPISLIEAMASGLPVVGTDVTGIKDVINHKTNGFLVELNNEKQLSDALHKLVEDPQLRLRFGKKSREMAESTYALKGCIETYQHLFNSCS